MAFIHVAQLKGMRQAIFGNSLVVRNKKISALAGDILPCKFFWYARQASDNMYNTVHWLSQCNRFISALSSTRTESTSHHLSLVSSYIPCPQVPFIKYAMMKNRTVVHNTIRSV